MCIYARKDDARNIKRLTRVFRDIAWLGHLSVVSYRALNVHNFTIIIARITYVSSVCRLRANKGWSRNRARGFSGAGAPGTRKVSRYVDPVVARKWNQIFSKARVPYAIRAKKKKKKKKGRTRAIERAQSDLWSWFTYPRGSARSGYHPPPSFTSPWSTHFPPGCISRCFDIIEHRCRLATVRLISLQAHPGALCVGNGPQQWKTGGGGRERGWRDSVGPLGGSRFSRIIPSTSRGTPRRARPFAPSVPHGTRRLRPLSRDEGRCSIYSVINSAAASSFSPARARHCSLAIWIMWHPSFTSFSNRSR